MSHLNTFLSFSPPQTNLPELLGLPTLPVPVRRARTPVRGRGLPLLLLPQHAQFPGGVALVARAAAGPAPAAH